MNGILTPEIIIYQTLENIVSYVREDLKKNAENLKNSWLYKLLGVDEDNSAIKMNRYEYFKQAKKVFESEQNLSVSFGYNPEVAKLLSLHIILPSEQTANTSLGEDEGYQTEIVDGKVQEKLVQLFRSTYQIMISGTNSGEINLVYNVLKASFIALVPHFSLKGLLTPTISGNDIVFKDDLLPSGIFHRVLNLSFLYELVVPQMLMKDLIKSVTFKGRVVNND